MKKRIFLADLTHTGRGIHAAAFPLGMAFVASYAKKHLGDEFDIEIFKFPDQLSKAIIDRQPDILCMSNYSWNLELAYKFSSLAKQKNPNLIVIFGGPNFPVLNSERKEFFKQRPVIDFYIWNEGEVGLVDLVKKIQKYNFDIVKLKDNKESIINCIYLNNDILVEGEFQRILELDTIPSPYLTGVLDKFFDLPLSPMLETTRGCPFSCAFCADGGTYKNRVARFSHERTKEELKYIVEHIKKIDELVITDLNFGMYKEDVVTANYIADIQKKYNWPVVLQASFGKNNKKQIMEVAAILSNSIIMGASMQSSDPEVLKNIKRNNISLDTCREFLEFGNNLSRDTLTYTEVILALPGDKKETHFKSLRHGIENGARNLKMYQAMLLAGTTMASQKIRHKYQFKTKFRVIPGGVGVYQFDGQSVPIAEIEEIIVGNKDMSFDDYVSCRIMNLFIETYLNNALSQEVFAALEAMDVSIFDCLLYLHKHKELYTPKMKEIIDRFIDATTNDLYSSRKETEEYVLQPNIIKKYISGDLGVNELLVFRAELYKELEDISRVLLMAIKNYLSEKGLLNNRVKNYFEQLIEFMLCKKKAFYEYASEIKHSFKYDFKAIDKLNYKIDPRTLEPNESKFIFKFYHKESQKKHIQNCLNLYINTPHGLGRVIQRGNLKKMYRTFDYYTEEEQVVVDKIKLQESNSNIKND